MCLNQARYGIAWGAVGAAMSCYDCALQYALLRKQWRDQPIASHQLVQDKLTWMISEITKAQLLVLQVGRSERRRQSRAAPHLDGQSATMSGWPWNARACRATFSVRTV